MRELRSVRVIRALVAVWFVLTVGEPSVLRTCPMHASAAATVHGAGHGDAHAHHHDAGTSDSRAPHGHQCNCISSCVACSFAALTSNEIQLELPSFGGSPLANVPDVAVAHSDASHVLPPSTGPPRV